MAIPPVAGPVEPAAVVPAPLPPGPRIVTYHPVLPVHFFTPVDMAALANSYLQQQFQASVSQSNNS